MVVGEPRVEEAIPEGLRRGPLEWLREHRRPNVVVDLGVESHFDIDAAYATRGYRSVVRLPIFSQEKVVGSLGLYSLRAQAFSRKELETLDPIVAQLAVALEN